jgi:hypothetical protein
MLIIVVESGLGLLWRGIWSEGLERLTKPLDIPPTDERAGKQQESLVHICSPLMPDAQSAEAV